MVNTIDLFAGCGGLTEGFKQSGHYNTVACVEWDKAPCDNLRHHLESKWHYKDVNQRVLRFDIQRVNELLNGWNDTEYGQSKGLDSLVSEYGGVVDLIIGGPPCQAYSVAGRIRDQNAMKDDYRNYLFESYLTIVEHYKPKAFVFENVPGMLSARPGDGSEKIVDVIHRQFSEAGYVLLDDLSNAIIDFTEYGIPQNRKRLIILGVSRETYGESAKTLLREFYNSVLPSKRVAKKRTVRDAIGDLPKMYPLNAPIRVNGKQFSHSFAGTDKYANHFTRYNSAREIEIFKLLTNDIQNGSHKYTSTESLKELYTQTTGKESNIHKYHVLRWDEQSNTIPAHLYKDGLRHIHPDPEQARSISVREAARLQAFPDNYEFITGTALEFKMIGNAVPPLFAKILGDSVFELLFAEK